MCCFRYITWQSIRTCGRTIPLPATNQDHANFQRDMKILELARTIFLVFIFLFGILAVLPVGISVVSIISTPACSTPCSNALFAIGAIFAAFLVSTTVLYSLFDKTRDFGMQLIPVPLHIQALQQNAAA